MLVVLLLTTTILVMTPPASLVPVPVVAGGRRVGRLLPATTAPVSVSPTTPSHVPTTLPASVVPAIPPPVSCWRPSAPVAILPTASMLSCTLTTTRPIPTAPWSISTLPTTLTTRPPNRPLWELRLKPRRHALGLLVRAVVWGTKPAAASTALQRPAATTATTVVGWGWGRAGATAALRAATRCPGHCSLKQLPELVALWGWFLLPMVGWWGWRPVAAPRAPTLTTTSSTFVPITAARAPVVARAVIATTTLRHDAQVWWKHLLLGVNALLPVPTIPPVSPATAAAAAHTTIARRRAGRQVAARMWWHVAAAARATTSTTTTLAGRPGWWRGWWGRHTAPAAHAAAAATARRASTSLTLSRSVLPVPAVTRCAAARGHILWPQGQPI